VKTNQFLFAIVMAQTADNSNCTATGIPYSCCTGLLSGSCQDASSATIEVPSGWTEIRHDTCGTDVVMSIAYRTAQSTDTSESQFTWDFLGQGQPADSSSCTDYGTPYACCTGNATGTCPYAPFLASGGITLVANVDTVTPIENVSELCTLDSTTLTAPSINTTENNSLVLLGFGIVGDNDISKPAGYSVVYQHSIALSGPDIANLSSTTVFPSSGTSTGDQSSTADLAGDNIGYQVGLSPPVP